MSMTGRREEFSSGCNSQVIKIVLEMKDTEVDSKYISMHVLSLSCSTSKDRGKDSTKP